MSYASEKGRASRSLNPLNRPAPAPLSDTEKEAVAERARAVKEHLPEAWDAMKALHEAGLIDGLRCIASVTVFEVEG